MLLPDGSPAPPEAYPLARVLLRGETVEDEEMPYRLGDGTPPACAAAPRPCAGRAARSRPPSSRSRTPRRSCGAQRAERFLAEVGEVLAASLESREILQQVARLCAGTLADYCMVHVQEGEGVRTVGMAHADPTREELVRGLLRRFPVHPSQEGTPCCRRCGRASRS